MSWNLRDIARKKMKNNQQRIWLELRTIDGKLVAKGDREHLLNKYREVNGDLGQTHFFMPASWGVTEILKNIRGTNLPG